MFCSYKCAGLYKQNYAICAVCGKEFKKSPSNTTTRTCGRVECRLKCRDAEIARENIKRAHANIKSSPNTGHFDTNCHAVEWRLVSPSGDLYEFKNLVLWAEENADLLPISPRTGKKVAARTFYREIMRLKSNNEKYTYFRTHYHGWKVLKDNKEDCE